MYNHTDKPFKFLVLSTTDPDDACHYPDAKKYKTKKDELALQNGARVDYWKVEVDPGVHWPSYALRGENL